MENCVNLLILADDLTGALDTGVQFAKIGANVEVYLSLDDATRSIRETGANKAAKVNGYPRADVRVINTDTRHASPDEARKTVAAAANAFWNCTHFYKKTDSCLRGNIGAELEAFMEATGCSRLPFVPAYPALKRTTRGGFQYLDGKPIHQSPMALDPLNPVTDSFIPSIIGKQTKIPVRLVPLYLAGTDPAGTEHESGTDIAGTEHILVFDAETPAHLAAAAKALREEGLLRVSAGCAGFAEALMEALPFNRGNEGVAAFTPADKLPILVVSGSLNPVSVGQVEAAREKSVPCFSVAEGDLLAEGWFGSENARSLAAECRRLLEAGGVCVLGTDLAIGGTPMGTDPETRPAASFKDGHSRQVARQVADGFGKIVQSVINETGPLHLVVFGGDTLLGIMKTLGYRYLRPLKEIYPGVVLAETDGGKGFFVTKSGAFGDRALISALKDFFGNN